jgi:hypothetical protein
VKITAQRRVAGVVAVAVLAVIAFAGGAYVADRDPAAGTSAFMREVAKRMNLTPSQLRTTAERPMIVSARPIPALGSAAILMRGPG